MKKRVDQPTPLLEILKELSKDSSNTTLRSWVKEGRVLVGTRRVDRLDRVVEPGEEVVVGPNVQFIRGKIRILYEDGDLVVLEKPSGLLSVATDHDLKPNVHTYLKKHFTNRRVYPVHRLDRETSGVMLFTFNRKAQQHLKKQFENHVIEKLYYAVIEGKLDPSTGRWESYLEEDDFFFVKTTGPSRGKLAITEYKQESKSKRYAFLALKPLTGRKNQLRVQCQQAGHPILGDKKYGSTLNPLKRLCLHAHSIAFFHPKTEKKLHFSIPLPEEFYRLGFSLKSK